MANHNILYFRVWRKQLLVECIASSSEEAVVRCVHIRICNQNQVVPAGSTLCNRICIPIQNNPLLLLQQLVLKNFISSVVLVVLVILYCFLYI